MISKQLIAFMLLGSFIPFFSVEAYREISLPDPKLDALINTFHVVDDAVPLENILAENEEGNEKAAEQDSLRHELPHEAIVPLSHESVALIKENLPVTLPNPLYPYLTQWGQASRSIMISSGVCMASMIVYAVVRKYKSKNKFPQLQRNILKNGKQA